VAQQRTVQSFDFISFVQTSKAISGFPTGNWAQIIGAWNWLCYLHIIDILKSKDCHVST
jgi:hypothetical protein